MTEPNPKGRAREAAEIRNDRDEIEAVEERILSDVERRGFPQSSRFAIKLALEEAVANAFRHGHRDLPKSTPVTVEFGVSDDEVYISVTDKGPGFDPGEIPDPTLDENIASPSGRGLMLMRAYMSEVRHHGDGRTVEMVYRRPTAEARA